MPYTAPSFTANGTIQPSRFVSIDTTANKLHYVIQSVSNDAKIFGVSQPGSYDAPGTNGAATDAARAGLQLEVYGQGEIALLEIGTGGCTAGDYLQPDANGKGVTLPAGTTVQHYGAKALETAVAGDKARVLVLIGGITPT